MLGALLAPLETCHLASFYVALNPKPLTLTLCVGYLLNILGALLAPLETCHLASFYVALNPKP